MRASYAAGSGHTCALLGDGTVQCRGYNFHGELGDGTTTNSSAPVAVSGITDATALATGHDRNCAVLVGGRIQCWGSVGTNRAKITEWRVSGRYRVFFVIELRSRAVQVAGIRIAPDGAWMMQVARNLLDRADGSLRNATHLIHDRDPLYTGAWTKLLESEGVKSVRIPASSPNCNPCADRFVRTARSECLDPFLLLGERHVRHLLGEFCEHYHGERFHQGLGGHSSGRRRWRATTTGLPAPSTVGRGLAG